MNRDLFDHSSKGTGAVTVAGDVTPELELDLRPGNSLLPLDFPDRLTTIRDSIGLSWNGMAEVLGVDRRQLDRWRHGAEPSGGAMMALCWLARKLPDAIDDLIAEAKIPDRADFKSGPVHSSWWRPVR